MNADEIRAFLAEREQPAPPKAPARIRGPHEHVWGEALETDGAQQLERCTVCPATRRRPVEWFALPHGLRVMVVGFESEWSLST